MNPFKKDFFNNSVTRGELSSTLKKIIAEGYDKIYSRHCNSHRHNSEKFVYENVNLVGLIHQIESHRSNSRYEKGSIEIRKLIFSDGYLLTHSFQYYYSADDWDAEHTIPRPQSYKHKYLFSKIEKTVKQENNSLELDIA